MAAVNNKLTNKTVCVQSIGRVKQKDNSKINYIDETERKIVKMLRKEW